MSHNLQSTANPPRRHSASSTTKTSEVSSAELVVENSHLLPTCPRRANDRDVTAMEEGELKDGKKKLFMMSPRWMRNSVATHQIVAPKSSMISAPALAVYIVGGGTSMAELTALARQDLPSVLGITSIGHLSEASTQQIVEGLCLGKKSCTLNISEAITYAWEPDANYGTNCSKTPTIVTIDSVANITKEVCEVQLNDDSDYSKCDADKPRALIVYGRCFTTRIDLSGAWSLKIIGWDSLSRREFLGLAVGCDIACSLAFFMVVIWLRRKEKEAVDRIAQNQIKALDYTVQLVNLPHHDDLNLLRQESPWSIVRRLEIAQQRHEKLQLLYGRLDERVYARRERRHLRAINKLETELHRFNVKLEQWHAHQKRYNISQAVTAFVTFEKKKASTVASKSTQTLVAPPPFSAVLQASSRQTTSVPPSSRSDRYYLGKPALFIARASFPTIGTFRNEPIYRDKWSNSHVTWQIVALITLSVLFLSFVFIFVAKEQKSKLERQYGRPSSCPTQVLKSDVVQDELNKVSELVPYKALVECYCKNFLVDHSFRSMMYESFYNPETGEDELLCRSWATTFVTTQILSIASVLLVVAVNLILARILNALVALEKHHTESSLVVSRVTKVFLAQFCNTALLMLVINANANYFSSSPTVSETGTTTGGFSLGVLQVLNGEYSDFSADWYNDVGVALMLTMILNSFSTHAYLLANYIMLKARRFVDRGYSFDHSLTKQDTQRDLEALYRGPKFDLAARYAQSLTSIFITYMFSAGMPLLHFIGFGAMFMTYWADKFTFLRIARSPPLYDSKLATAAGSLLPYAVLMHCLIAMWMFSNDRIFESESGETTVNSTYSPGDGIPLFDAARGQLISRVTRPQVVVLFAFFVAGCTIVIMRSVLFEYVPALIRSVFPGLARLLEKPRIAKGIPNYFDAIPTSCLQEKLSATSGTQQLLRPDLRAKYERALLNRIAQEEDVPKMRSKRSISDIERFNQANRIIGCPSYAISDNKEYVAKLAIDSHLSEQIPLDQIF
ncbi:Anoctamin [Phytophthora cactorum]|nr:Anoctamin [Phytophthora cactorum]